MTINETKIKSILGDYLEEEDIQRALIHSQEQHASLMEYLLSEKILEKDLLGQVWAEYFGLPYTDLNTNFPSREQRERIPMKIAQKFRVVFCYETTTGVTIATDSPEQFGLDLVLKELFPGAKTISLSFSLSEDIEEVLQQYRKPLETRFSQIIQKQQRIAPEILEEIFADALGYKASDIHFEPTPQEVVVRFRVDGILQEAGRLPREYYENILNRVKVQSRLRIDEHFSAQDGSIHYERDNQVVDIRTSIIPTVEGEKIVLRILASYVKYLSLESLGVSESNRIIFEEAARRPFGMVLVTGPTGSGKTTTLYTFLKLINHPEVNITTIEDPVEYRIEGVNQIQVNEETNLTFSQGLRSIVRQDPDIILVGEIRDRETAEIAVNAALTGHLLFSTFHANDASTAIPRLFEMGIEPFLLASTINIVVAQRLARRICEHCRVSVMLSDRPDFARQRAVFEAVFNNESPLVFYGKGCEACNYNGYKGRIALLECIRITPEMQTLLLRSPSKQEIWQLAEEQGAESLFMDGMRKVREGLTTMEEVLRVVEIPEHFRH